MGDWLTPERIALDLGLSTKAHVLAAAARLLAAEGEDPAAIEAALHAREADGTTGYGRGCAIPHGRAGQQPRAALLRLAPPVDWKALDRQPVRLVLALLSPPDDGAVHLKMLARASRAMADDRQRERLAGARDPAAAWAVVCRPGTRPSASAA